MFKVQCVLLNHIIKMNYFLGILIFLNTVSYFLATSESTKDVNDVDLKPSTKISLNDYISTPDTWELPALNSLWVYRPPPIQSHKSKEKEFQQMVLKTPHLVTRLAKPLTYGFDPFFNKGYFEPFERRQKPVTLVNFRKNGMQPRNVVQPSSESAEVAELQSPFNDISNAWHNERDIYI